MVELGSRVSGVYPPYPLNLIRITMHNPPGPPIHFTGISRSRRFIIHVPSTQWAAQTVVPCKALSLTCKHRACGIEAAARKTLCRTLLVQLETTHKFWEMTSGVSASNLAMKILRFPPPGMTLGPNCLACRNCTATACTFQQLGSPDVGADPHRHQCIRGR